MIEINIDPLLHVGSFEIKWITLALLWTFLIIIAVGVIGLRRIGIPLVPKYIIGISLWFIIGVLIGARLFYVLDNWSYYLKYPAQIIGLNGIVIYGALIGAVIAIAIYLCKESLPFWRWGDGIAPGAMLGMALYRIGCIINGCCYGMSTNLQWSVMYTNPLSSAPLNRMLHPTQFYHLGLSLISFAVLWALQTRLKREGLLFLLWLILFAVTDLPVRFFRVEPPFFLGIKLAILVDIVILIIAVPWLIIRWCSASNISDRIPSE